MQYVYWPSNIQHVLIGLLFELYLALFSPRGLHTMDSAVYTSWNALQRYRYVKLYRSKAYVHHFTSEGMDAAELPAAHESCMQLVARYKELEASSQEETSPRLKVL